MRQVLAVAALSMVLAGCSGKKADPVPPPPPVDPGPVTCLPSCAGTRSYDAIAYALSGRYDWPTSRLVASEEITLKLPAGAGPVVELDGTMQVTAVHAGTQRLAYAAGGATLRVDLGPLAPGTSPVTFTVDYTARAASTPPFYESLWATSSTAQDPVRSRMVFTDSEPHRGRNWLVQKDDPSDPALFSIALTVAADEDVVANGERISDTIVSGGHRVAYALDVPIATYLMAFAAGQLEHVDRPTGSSVPLRLWYRRGLAIDPAMVLDPVASAMATFEALLGPYPFARYGVLLQPAKGWGMENATITIESEDFGQDPLFSFEVNTHELAQTGSATT
jgi:aminopeptidase N